MKMSDDGFITIAKMEAAERQLITAIKLFFRDEDPFSIHTLIGAAIGILNDLAQQRGINNPITDLDVMDIRPDKRKEYFKMLRNAKNFLKHAKADPHATLRINPDVNKYCIIEGLHLYEELNEDIPGELFFYRIWFSYHHPNLFKKSHLPPLKITLKTITGGMIGDREMNDFSLITEVLDGLHDKRFPLPKSKRTS